MATQWNSRSGRKGLGLANVDHYKVEYFPDLYDLYQDKSIMPKTRFV